MRRTSLPLLVMVTMAIGAVVDGASPKPLTLIVTRQLRNNYGMFGKLQIEGQAPTEFVCYTLEKNMGAIPEGNYVTSLRYQSADLSSPPPSPTRPYIRLKAGSTQEESDGSILVGTNFATQQMAGKTKTTGLSNGRQAIDKLKAIFYPDSPASYDYVPVTVKVMKSSGFRDHYRP